MKKNKSRKKISSPGQNQKIEDTIAEIRNYLFKKGIWYAITDEEIISEFAELGENAT